MPIGGMFCGQAWGPSVFYSETRSLILTVKLFKLLREQNGYNFDFRIEYKFLSKEESVVRYGGIKSDIYENMTKETHHSSNNFDNKINSAIKKSKAFDNYQEDFTLRANNWYESTLNLTSSTTVSGGKSQRKSKTKTTKNVTVDAKYYLGDLIPGTYCSRIYSNCDKKLCRLQSPNFPGTYPRNLTCYYAVRQVSMLEKRNNFLVRKTFVYFAIQPLIIIHFFPLIQLCSMMYRRESMHLLLLSSRKGILFG